MLNVALTPKSKFVQMRHGEFRRKVIAGSKNEILQFDSMMECHIRELEPGVGIVEDVHVESLGALLYGVFWEIVTRIAPASRQDPNSIEPPITTQKLNTQDVGTRCILKYSAYVRGEDQLEVNAQICLSYKMPGMRGRLRSQRVLCKSSCRY